MASPVVAGERQPRSPPKRWLLGFSAAVLLLAAIALYLGLEKPWSKDNSNASNNNAASAPSAIKTQAARSSDAAVPSGSGLTSSPLPTAPVITIPASESTGGQPSNVAITTPTLPAADKQVVPGGLGDGFCTIATAAELSAAVAGATCNIIYLTSSEYVIPAPLIVTRPLLILGAGLTYPLIHGPPLLSRLFHVLDGGALEVRNIRTYPGTGEYTEIGGVRVHLRVGTVARVELGGSMSMVGCFLEQQTQTVQNFISQLTEAFEIPRITLGGYIFVAGGTFNMMGCTIFRYAPLGNPNPTDLSLGRDILLLAGTANLVGVTYISIQLWHVKLTVGGVVAVLGGTLGVYGLSLGNIIALNNQFGAGLQTFVGGGNAVFVGLSRAAFSLTTVRGSYGLFSVGGGTLTATGTNQASFSVVRAEFGTGTWSLGGGAMNLVAIQSYSAHVSAATYGAGFHYFNGGGQFFLLASQRANNGVTTFQSGNGFHTGQQSGVLTFIYGTSYTTAMCRYQEGMGTEAFLGAGFLTFVRVFRFRIIGLGTFVGLGNQVYVAAGAGIFIDNKQAAYIIDDWRSNAIIVAGRRTNVVYTVNGATATRGQANQDIFMGLTRVNVPGFPFRMLEGADNSTANSTATEEIPKAVALIIGDKYFEHKLPLDAIIERSKSFNPFNPTASLFDKYEELVKAQGVAPNKLAISSSNTDCMACDVPAEQLVGSSPCIASTCPGDTVLDRTKALFNNAPVAVPASLTSLATDVGLLSNLRRHSRGLSEEQQEAVNNAKIRQFQHRTTVFCAAAAKGGAVPSSCGTTKNFEDALAFELGDYTGAREGFTLSVHEEKLPAELFKYFGNELDPLTATFEPTVNGACEGWSTFLSIVTVRDDAQFERIKAAWQATADNSTTLLQNLRLVADPAVSLCELEVKQESVSAVLSTPSAVNAQFLTQANALGASLPSVTLTGSEDFGFVTKAGKNRDYSVGLTRFAPGSTVSVKLIDVASGNAVKVIKVIPSFPIKGTSFTWQVPADVPTNQYYVLRASGKSALSGGLTDDSVQFLLH